MDTIIQNNIYWVQTHLSAETLTIWLFFLCAASIIGLMRFYGLFGLYVYNCLAIIFANIQVLRFTQYQYFAEPVALGTVLFTTTFLVNDIITEHYGKSAAKKSVSLGFSVQLLTTIWMIITLSHPLPQIEQSSPAVRQGLDNHFAMLQIFTPSLRILIASLTAYLCSQWLDIIIFSKVRDMTKGKYLWLRQNFAMFISGLLDTFLFSAIAWMWLNDVPISWSELIIAYVLSAQVTRVLLNISFTPLMYLSYKCRPSYAAVSI